jgi:hypothetical protein
MEKLRDPLLDYSRKPYVPYSMERSLPEKLTGLQLVKKFLRFMKPEY